MSGQAIAVGANPFSRRAALLLLVLGSALFVALLWLIATGNGGGSTNDGGAHVGGQGLNGYAAMADYLGRRGYVIERTQNKGALARPGLLVLTPPAGAKGSDIDDIVSHRRRIGPTLVIAPKWQAMRATNEKDRKARKGWVELAGTQLPEWEGFLDDIGVSLEPAPAGARWSAKGLSGPLPAPANMESGAGTGLVGLVEGPGGRHTLAGFIDDGGTYPGLESMVLDRVLHSGQARGLYPIVLVFEPDLLDNYGMGHFASAQLAEALVRASGVKPGGTVNFDMTLNGFGHSDNLLTLAFRPPFLAATLCLLMAALLIGWRAFMRFGPPLQADRAIAFGKRALVANTAGMIRRSQRLHLMGVPYAERARRRIAASLTLRPAADPAETDAAIDRALAARHGAASESDNGEPFSALAARLEQARRPHDLLKAARDIDALERKLLR